MVEWQGCKQMGVDSVIYQLQILCIGKGEHEYKSVSLHKNFGINIKKNKISYIVNKLCNKF